ncbi:MAG: hypothetical protein KGY67_00780 [Candidatus Thermoplasmatota archaeon]|nr:hypothetical protein [Candidatus Thermoplasmatota archaeon]
MKTGNKIFKKEGKYVWKVLLISTILFTVISGFNLSSEISAVENSSPQLSIESIYGGFGTHTVIKNIGDSPATDVTWNTTVKGNTVIRGDKIIPPIPVITTLNPGESVEVSSWKYDYILGFGEVDITVGTSCNEQATDQKTQKGILIGVYIVMK